MLIVMQKLSLSITVNYIAIAISVKRKYHTFQPYHISNIKGKNTISIYNFRFLLNDKYNKVCVLYVKYNSTKVYLILDEIGL